MDCTSSKKTLGRRKIEIKKIEKKNSLQVTFTKRRMGLFRKASELSVLCGSEIAILVQSPANKIFTFGNPSVEYVLDRYQTGRSNFPNEYADNMFIRDNNRSKYDEAVRKLEGGLKMEKRLKRETENENGFWWEASFEDMELDELEEFMEALEGLRSNVLNGVENFEKQKVVDYDSLALENYYGSDHEFNCNDLLIEFNGKDFDGSEISLDGVQVQAPTDIWKYNNAASSSSSDFSMNNSSDFTMNNSSDFYPEDSSFFDDLEQFMKNSDYDFGYLLGSS